MESTMKRSRIMTALDKYNKERNEVFPAGIFVISCSECRPAIIISCDRNSAIVTFCRKVIASLNKYKGAYSIVGISVSDDGKTTWLKSRYGSVQIAIKMYNNAEDIPNIELDMAASLFIEELA